MSRNRETKDLIQVIKELEQRIANLERSRQLSSSSVDSGFLKITDGAFIFQGALGSDKGIITMNNTTVDGESGYAFIINRSESSGGWDALTIRTVEGDGFPTIDIKDKSGGTMISDAWVAHSGMSDPRLHTPWHDPNTLKTTTSSTMAVVAAATWYMYHPHLMVEVIVNNDATATSEVQVREFGGNILASAIYEESTNGYFTLLCDRADTQFGFPNVNGNSAFIYVEHKRTSGAGTARTGISDMLGIDMSLFV